MRCTLQLQIHLIKPKIATLNNSKRIAIFLFIEHQTHSNTFFSFFIRNSRNVSEKSETSSNCRRQTKQKIHFNHKFIDWRVKISILRLLYVRATKSIKIELKWKIQCLFLFLVEKCRTPSSVFIWRVQSAGKYGNMHSKRFYGWVMT